MKRVVVTGMGIVSCLGNDLRTVQEALRLSRGGIGFCEEFARNGLRSHVCGLPALAQEPAVERKLRRFMGDPALYAYHALRKAITDAGIAPETIASPRTGLVVGSGTGSLLQLVEAVDVLRSKGIHGVSPYAVPQVMGSTTSACLATAFGIRGPSYSLSSACATSAHCIGHGRELVQFGKQEVVLAGGAEEARWPSAALFDAMGALSTRCNDNPGAASRPYDRDRDGFVIAGGSGILVLESLDHAQARGARIYAELIGYGACGDGSDMIIPTAEGMARAMRAALDEAGLAQVDYLNAHGTSTQAGDLVELEAIRTVFGERMPLISSTKGLSGHAIGAAGVHEAIYCMLMMTGGFVAPCTNLEAPDPATRHFPLVTRAKKRRIDTAVSNSLGFGGSNASLVLRRWPVETRP